jgi:hypothetical protein
MSLRGDCWRNKSKLRGALSLENEDRRVVSGSHDLSERGPRSFNLSHARLAAELGDQLVELPQAGSTQWLARREQTA